MCGGWWTAPADETKTPSPVATPQEFLPWRYFDARFLSQISDLTSWCWCHIFCTTEDVSLYIREGDHHMSLNTRVILAFAQIAIKLVHNVYPMTINEKVEAFSVAVDNGIIFG